MPQSRRSFLMSGLAASQAPRDPANITPRYRVLGKTGLRVTELGYGSEAVSDPSVLARGLDLGINFFDTAHAYEGGNNERYLGQALNGRRKQIVLSSRSYGKTAADLRRDLDESLRELRTDYLDIWYIGSKDKPADVTADMLDVQRAAQKAGKIRFRGFSTHRPSDMLNFILENRFDVVQFPYNFAIGSRRDPMKLDGRNLDHFLDRLKEAGTGVVAMKVTAGGYRVREPGDPLYGVYQRSGAHVAAIRWALRSNRIQTTSVRMTDHDQLLENIQAMAGAYSPADEKLLAMQLDRIRPVFCRMCGACDGACPKGLPASDMVRFVTYADGYGDERLGRARFRALPAALQSVRCSDCESCAIHCPNGVQVRSQLIRAQTLFA